MCTDAPRSAGPKNAPTLCAAKDNCRALSSEGGCEIVLDHTVLQILYARLRVVCFKGHLVAGMPSSAPGKDERHCVVFPSILIALVCQVLSGAKQQSLLDLVHETLIGAKQSA